MPLYHVSREESGATKARLRSFSAGIMLTICVLVFLLVVVSVPTPTNGIAGRILLAFDEMSHLGIVDTATAIATGAQSVLLVWRKARFTLKSR